MKDLPKSSFKTEYEFSDKIHEFISLLGYNDSQLFFGVHLRSEQHLRADAIVASNRAARPWILIEIKLINQISKNIIFTLEKQLKKYASIANPEYAVLISGSFIIILYKEKTFIYNLNDLTIKQSSEIYKILKNPTKLPTESIITENYTLNKIESETFNLDLIEYSQKLDSVLAAETNEEKKKSLEGLAKLLLKELHFYHVNI